MTGKAKVMLKRDTFSLNSVTKQRVKKKLKLSHYTPWMLLRGEEV
jgi:hypothetical protein